MKKLFLILVSLLLVVGTSEVWAQMSNQDQQNVTIEIRPINFLKVSGNPQTLVIDSVDPDTLEPLPATDSSTTYMVVTNQTNKKIVGSINSDLPSGVELKINLQAPSGATSLGHVSLKTGAEDLVRGISKQLSGLRQIQYTAEATADVGPQTIQRTVMLVLVDGQ